MNGKELLIYIVELQNDINKIDQQIEMLKSALISTGIRYDKEKIQTSNDPDPMASAYAKIDEKEREKLIIQRKCVELKVKAVEMICTICDELYQNVLHGKYIKGYSFKTIAKDLEYSYAYIIETHGKALKVMENIQLNPMKSNNI